MTISSSSSSTPRSTDRPSTSPSSDRAPSGRPPRNRGPRRPSGDSPRPAQQQRSNAPVPEAPVAAPVAPASTEPAITSFAELGVPANLVAVLASQGIDSAFPIQSATLPDSLAGRDVLGRGRTGSGKTIAFALPLVAGLVASGRRARPGHPRAVVLLPTRELATQVHEAIAPLAKVAGLTTTTVFGGVSQRPQVAALRSGVDILVACPGRLEDLVSQRQANLEDIEITVLDEADHMADLGFLPVVKRLLDRTPRKGQRLLFSATLDGGIDGLAKRYLTDPVTHSVDSAQAAVSTMSHHVLHVSSANRLPVLVDLTSAPGRTMVFTRTKHRAKQLTRQLIAAGVPTVEMHGNLAQNARTRNLALFSDGRATALVATDIAARGIHVDDVSLVIHADPPTEHKAYLHRSGRTARAGAEGTVVTLATEDQRKAVKQLSRAAGIDPDVSLAAPGDEVLRALAPGDRVLLDAGEIARRLQSPTPSPAGGSRPAGSGGPSRRRTPRPDGRPAARSGNRSGGGSGRSGGGQPSGRSGGSGNGGGSPAGPSNGTRRSRPKARVAGGGPRRG